MPDLSWLAPSFMLIVAAAYLIAKFLHSDKYEDPDLWDERLRELLDEEPPLSKDWRAPRCKTVEDIARNHPDEWEAFNGR